MPNDAKLGMVVGVGLVIAVAIVFFRKELTPLGPDRGRPPANVAPPTDPGLPRSPRARTPQAMTASRAVRDGTAPRRHLVADGETLYTIAEHYYGDGERFIDLYEANRATLRRPDRLEPGTELEVPTLPKAE